MCEINSHGGMVVERKILEQCLLNGAELAEPGEFTKRAFMNGRIDLSQAESVIDIINAKSDKEAEASFSQLQGSLSKKMDKIRDELLDIMSDIEASIDYPEYDIEETTNIKATTVLTRIKEELNKLEKSFENGKLLKEGVKTVIIGRPNAGKSSQHFGKFLWTSSTCLWYDGWAREPAPGPAVRYRKDIPYARRKPP